MDIVQVDTSPQYKVYIGPGITDSLGELLEKSGVSHTLAVVTDSHVAELYLERVLDTLKGAGYTAHSFVFPAGEESKNMKTLGDILEFFALSGLGRGDFALALGGGVTGDLTGFAAGCYMRGIDYVQLPTTVLAAVDSSVGGKTAVDLSSGKNLAGLFIQPRAVVCDTQYLASLPDAVFADGMAEAIKTGILSGQELFSLLSQGRSRESLVDIIKSCVAYKAKIVQEDERELGIRKCLNLGHTPAHGIELLSGYKISHGHAVAMGTAIMARSAANRNLMSREYALAIQNALSQNGLPITSPYGAKELAKAALSDKKRRGDSITLVTPRAMGNCTLDQVHINELENIFSAGMETM